MKDLNARVIDYITSNPGARSLEVASELGVPQASIVKTLWRLEKAGQLKTRRTGNHNPKRQVKLYYVQHEPRSEADVLSIARQIGHPFGIVAAQVMA